MLTFLSPLFLVGLLSAAIPLLIHLSRSRRTKTMKFSTTRFFTDQFLRSYRMSRLKELLLLACRMALCALLATAMARPLLLPRGLAAPLGGSRSVVLVVDDSASMGYTEAGQTLLDRARATAKGLIEGLRPGDTASLVLAGRRAGGPEVLFPRPTPALGDVLQALDAVKPASLGTDLSGAVARAETIALAGPATSKEVYVLSDLQDSGWSLPEKSDEPPGNVRFFFVAVKPKDPANLAVTAIQYAAARPMAGVPFSIRPHIVAQGSQGAAVARLVVDGKPVAERRLERLEGGRWAVPRFDHTFPGGGWHSGYVEVPDPVLPQDNRRYFAFEVLDSVRVLAVNGAPSKVPRLDELFFLKLALTAAAEGRGAIQVDTVSPEALTGSELGKYPLVILANVESLSAPAVEALESFADRGGSVLIFLGDHVNPSFYNTNLAAPTRLHGGLMPGRLLGREGDPSAPADVATVGAVSDDHPAMVAFHDPQFASLAGVGFKALWGLDPAPNAAILMSASTGAPLLVEKPFGKGRVLAFASTCDRDWTNFPVRPAFLPWIHRIVGHLAQEPVGRSGFFTTGTPIPIPVAASEGLPQVSVRQPDGSLAQPVASDDPDHPLIFANTAEAGVYTLLDPSRPAAGAAFAVNLASDESDLTYLDDVLAARGGSTTPDRTTQVEAGLKELLPNRPLISFIDDPARAPEIALGARRSRPLWDLALWAVLLIGLIEPWIANRISLRHYARPRDLSPVFAGDALRRVGTAHRVEAITSPPPTSSPTPGIRSAGDQGPNPVGGAHPTRAQLSLPPLFAVLRFESVAHPWLWLIFIAAGAALLVWTYREIARRAERRLAWGLLALRACGLLALVLALAKPTWTHESDLVDPGRVAVVLDNSGSMTLADPSGKARYDRARAAVESLRTALEAGRSGPGVELDLFDITGAPLDVKKNRAANVERTDLVRAVSGAIARLRSRPLAGVVLVSDGMDNTGRPDLRALADAPVPIHTVGFQADLKTGGLDLAVRDVHAPKRAMVHNQVKVDVTVTKSDGPATKAAVVVKRGSETFATQPVDFGAGRSEQTVSLTLTPSQAGTFVFTAAVSGTTGERLLANNAAHFPLRVDSEPIRVLYLEGFLRYEFKYLKNRLEDDPDVSLVSVVRRLNPERTDPEAKAADRVVTPDRLKNFDVVILGDMEASYLAPAEAQAILKWLDEKDHAVLALGGYRSFGPDGLRTTPLAEALPVTFAEAAPYQSEDPFVLQLTEEGRRHPIFEVSGDRVKDAAAWSIAPALSGTSLVKTAKPGADVLAVDPSVTIDGRPAVVVAVQRFGAGHTMVLAADTTWRWSRFTRVLGRADTLYARFWSQTVRWLAGRSSNDQRPPLVVSTDRPDYDVGKPVAIRAVRQPKPGEDLRASDIAVEVAGPFGRTISVPLRSSSAEPDVFTGTYYPPVGGRYELAATLTLAREGKPIANQTTEFLVHGADLELADPGTNPAALRALSTATGGTFVDVADAASLADKINRKERRTRRVERTELWHSPMLFFGFLGFVTAEWFLRRRNHLV